ncbi:MAG: dethiobiotin synthase [Gammaproteobacteria bacterium]|jgi:dethiobiotin synthetase
MRGVFVTGTDTDCGKTVVAGGLIRTLADAGFSAAGFKPVAAGAAATPAGLRNDDALALQAASVPRPAYERVNPICLAPPIAPHIAAAEAGRAIGFAPIRAAHAWLAARYQALVVEGAGGWRVPLGPDGDMADLAVELGHPVVLVVGLRLGCLNHALLTAAAIRGRGLELLGWVGNLVDPGMARLDDNLATLRERLEAPCLGVVPGLDDPMPARAAAHLAEFRRLFVARADG